MEGKYEWMNGNWIKILIKCLYCREGKKRKLEADEPFPRGGGSSLTPLEFKEVKRKAEADFLFQEVIYFFFW